MTRITLGLDDARAIVRRTSSRTRRRRARGLQIGATSWVVRQAWALPSSEDPIKK